MYPVTALETAGLSSGCRQGRLREAVREGLLQAVSWLWCLWCPLARRCVSLPAHTSLHVCLSVTKSPLAKFSVLLD